MKDKTYDPTGQFRGGPLSPRFVPNVALLRKTSSDTWNYEQGFQIIVVDSRAIIGLACGVEVLSFHFIY